ncbi:hypothetical protein BFJ72_g12622 [Fusarium proliferatum]|uniref:NB-ARC domain-containing protein n=1 Tax=Gibberella intermedia TaxID=948311 RepID=A0A420SFV8_GIBIN|nr:hypothetical protein BFJ72_g12622 [Fusarium proliferatum]
MSVFWFAAESPQSIDRDLQATSRMINSAQPSKSPLEPRAFRSWLSKECREPWLVILDNAYEGLDVRDLVPPTGGKTVVTAKHAAVLTHNKFVSKQVPPLRLEHAWSLFISSCSTRLDPAPSRLPMPSTAAPVLERLANRPIAICLAAAVMGAVNSGNPAQDLQNFQDQQVIGEDSLDFSVWKWSYLLLSQLNPSESFLIGLICVFNSEWVSDAFIDLIAKSASPNSIFYRRQHTRSFNRLLQLRLVQRRSNFTQQYYYVPSAIKECTVRYLKIIHIHGGIQRVLQEAFDIVHSIFGTIRLGTGSDGSQSLEILSPHIQALCIRAKKEDFDLPNSLQHHLFRVCHFALKEATQQIERFCHKQYWRTWLLSNNCSLNEANQGEDDGSDLIIHPIYHEWIDLRSTAHCKAHRDVRHLLQEDIVSNFMDDLNKSTVLAAIGSAWHGVRDEIFDFIRNHECARKDDGQIKLIIDAVDKGGCEGLQCATVEQLRSDEYISEVSEDSSRALDSLVDIIAAAITASGINILHCSSEILSAVKGALNESWETLRLSSFYQMCGAFESVLSGQTVSLVRSIVESALTSNAQLDGFENPTAFAVQTMGNGPLKSRISLVSQGYWNVTSALTFFIASGMLRDLSAVALDTGSDMRNPEAVSEHLMTWAIDLLRAGIMSCGLQYSPVWKLALKDAVFRCVQVEECRGAWGGISGSYKYSTQDQWEEYQLLL